MHYQPVLQVTRGDVVESVHYGAGAVADRHGKLTAWWGDPEAVSYLRSSAKPFQALPLLESGAADHFGLSERQLAVICASHSGTDAHVEVVASIQSRVGVTENDLLCGVHPPGDSETASRLRAAGLDPTPNRHNCSGKHSGMLALARFLGETIEDYISLDHPVQRRILAAFAEMCDLAQEDIAVGIDGCSVPTFAVPLRAAAVAYARLADPRDLPETRARACRRIFEAMCAHPDMVAGPGKLDTRLMMEARGRLVAKGGAEGYHGVGLAPGALGAGSPGLGIAAKIADGDTAQRAGGRVILAVLHTLGVLGAEDLERLADLSHTRVTNWRNLLVGEMHACPPLERAP